MGADDEPRRIILARRARFVSATIAAMAACAPAARPPEVETVPGRRSPVPQTTPAVDAEAMPDASDAAVVEAGSGVVPKVIVSVCLSIILPRVQFQRGASAVHPAAAPVLDTVAATLANEPQISLDLEGHTDPTERPDVGLARAEAVKRALEARGVDPARLHTTNAGSSRPMASNATAEGRDRNRRVDFLVR